MELVVAIATANWTNGGVEEAEQLPCLRVRTAAGSLHPLLERRQVRPLLVRERREGAGRGRQGVAHGLAIRMVIGVFLLDRLDRSAQHRGGRAAERLPTDDVRVDLDRATPCL